LLAEAVFLDWPEAAIHMQIFIAGGTGVVGRRVIPSLLAQGHSVTVAVRPSARAGPFTGTAITHAVVDLFNVDDIKRAIAGHDTIINLATHVPSLPWKMMFRRAWRTNDRIRTEGVANIVEAALSRGITRIIQESFAFTYPDRGDCWIDEQTPIKPADYTRSVLDAEKSIADFSGGSRTGVALRFAAFYGPDAMQVRTYIQGLRRGWAVLPGGPERFISSVSHDDAADAVVVALKAPPGVYTVVDDEPVRRSVYFGSLAGTLGLKAPRFLPSWTTPLFGTLGEAMSRSLRLSNRKLRQATGWAPRFPSIREGWPVTMAQMGEI
jgi:2-alkyl-3-oxoalkanoate reductase